MGGRRYQQGRRSSHPVVPNIFPSLGGKLGIRLVTVTSALVALVATGCGTTPAPSAFDSLPQETATAATTVPATTVSATTAQVATTAPVPKATAPVPKATVLPPENATTGVQETATPRPNRPTPVQGSDPVVWLSALCGGFNEGIATVSAIGNSQPTTPQGAKDELLQVLDADQQAFTNTAHKLKQLGAPGVPGGKQAQDAVVGFLTTVAATVGDSRGKVAALDVNDPDFEQKASQLVIADLGVASTQPPGVTSNQELAPELLAIPECAKLAATHP
jgi:hypothetical protein